jgi:hypothetical protein
MLESPVDVDTSSNESPSTDFPPKKKSRRLLYEYFELRIRSLSDPQAGKPYSTTRTRRFFLLKLESND